MVGQRDLELVEGVGSDVQGFLSDSGWEGAAKLHAVGVQA